jgi:hypothetical protein
MPWYRADVLKRGFNPTDRVPRGVHICIGHRKRVWEISVTCDTTTDNAIPWYADAEKALAAEEVTKFFGPKKIIVHAWNDKLHEYLNTIAVVGDLRLDPAR